MNLQNLSQILTAVSVLCTASAANAETHGDYSFYSVRTGTSSRVGEIIDVVFKVSAFAKEGLTSDATVEDIVRLCKAQASVELTKYLKENKNKSYKYFSITLEKGDGVGMYLRFYFKGNMDCVPQKLSTLN